MSESASSSLLRSNQAVNAVRFASDSELIVQSPGGKPGDFVDITVQFEPGGEIKIQKEAYENKKGFQFVEKKYRQPGVDDLNTNKDSPKKDDKK